jgi:hypothetical protein
VKVQISNGTLQVHRSPIRGTVIVLVTAWIHGTGTIEIWEFVFQSQNEQIAWRQTQCRRLVPVLIYVAVTNLATGFDRTAQRERNAQNSAMASDLMRRCNYAAFGGTRAAVSTRRLP